MADDGDGDCGGDGGVSLQDRVSKDCIVVVRDSKMPRGHKSSQRGHDGHMAAVVVDNNIPLVTVVDVPLVIACHSMGELNTVNQSEDTAGAPVVEPVGYAAYGDSGVRQEFAKTERRLVAPARAIPSESISTRKIASSPGRGQWDVLPGR